jgi:hypothetical protein
LNTKYKILKQLGASNIQINTLQTTVKFSKWEIVIYIYIYIYGPCSRAQDIAHKRHVSKTMTRQEDDLGIKGLNGARIHSSLGGSFGPVFH